MPSPSKPKCLWDTHYMNCLLTSLTCSSSLPHFVPPTLVSLRFLTLRGILPQSRCACPSLGLECSFPDTCFAYCHTSFGSWVLTHLLGEASLTTLPTLDTSYCPSLLLFPPPHFSLSNTICFTHLLVYSLPLLLKYQ